MSRLVTFSVGRFPRNRLGASLVQKQSQLTNEETRTHGKLVPLPLRHKLPLLIQKLLVSPVDLGRPPLILIVGRFATIARLLLSLVGRGKVLTLHIQGLKRAIAFLLSNGSLLTLWMIGSDVIAGVIVGVRSGLFLGGWSSRKIGGRGQRRGMVLCLRRLGGHLCRGILGCRRIVGSRCQRVQEGLYVNIGASVRVSLVVSALGRLGGRLLSSIGMVMGVWVRRRKTLSSRRRRVSGRRSARLELCGEILH